jgi:hypothetical protein
LLVVDRMVVGLLGGLIGYSVGWYPSSCWLIGLLVCWFVGWLFEPVGGSVVGWLVGWLAWLVGWLAWLVG